MRTLAILERTTKKGYRSVWHFVEGLDGFYAFGGCKTPMVKKFATRKQLRALYNSYIRYGYKQVAEQLELALA